jgi:hypothetical protein
MESVSLLGLKDEGLSFSHPADDDKIRVSFFTVSRNAVLGGAVYLPSGR